MTSQTKTRTTDLGHGETLTERFVAQYEARYLDNDWGTGWAVCEVETGDVLDWAETRRGAERIADENNWIECE